VDSFRRGESANFLAYSKTTACPGEQKGAQRARYLYEIHHAGAAPRGLGRAPSRRSHEDSSASYSRDGHGHGQDIHRDFRSGTPVYSYSLKQGIHDAFLAPYKVIKVHIDRDIEGYRTEAGKLDRDGNEVEDRIYNQKDFDRTFVIDERTQVVARKISDLLKESEDRFQKTIVFCVDTFTLRGCPCPR
jgi:hypothetical protein